MSTRSVRVSDKKSWPNVPMVMYHSVIDVNDSWPYRFLSCPVSIFESHLKALHRAKYQTISLQQLYDHMTQGIEIPARSVVLTFDDGYLDNWVYVYPLLKKYGFQGTIFVNPEFVDPAEIPRPTLEEVWNKQISENELPTTGFLSWAEMRALERSGVMEIQSHSMTHTWYFSSGELIDFHHPGDPYSWLAWNACPERKHLWMSEDQQAFTPWGLPVYQHEKSLGTRRYFPDEGLNDVLIDYVKNHGGEAFFAASDWRKPLQKVVDDYHQTQGDSGRFETDKEYRGRLRHELSESKHILENNLNKVVNFLCWPGGGYNDTSVELSTEVGYLASTLSSRHRGKRNAFGEDPSRWGRISPPSIIWSPTTVEYQGGLHFILLVNAVRGSSLSNFLYRSLKVPHKVSQLLRKA